ncbi:MAG: GlcG/HbpS family heme-binding protein [Xanthobacteraceae bacterium]
MTSKLAVTLIGALALATGFAAPSQAQGVLTTHRLSAALAADAVTAAVAACAKQGYHVTATIIDPDGAVQAMLRGDGAGIVAVKSSYDKAYTVIMLGATSNLDSSGAIAARIGPNPPAGGIAKFAHIALQPGAFRIKVGNEAIAAIGVGGAPGGEHDEACAKAGLAKIADQLK